MLTLQSVLAACDALAPFATQEPWDNSGLQCGDVEAPVQTGLVALDLTPAVLAVARQCNADVLVTHHPVLFEPRRSLPAGDLLVQLIEARMACIALHTPWDKATKPSGTNIALAETLHLQEVVELEPMLLCGRLPQVCSAESLARAIATDLQAPVSFADAGLPIARLALCGGVGGSLFAKAGQALLTGEAKHHEFLAAQQMGVSLFVAGHAPTEQPGVFALHQCLAAALPQVTWHVVPSAFFPTIGV